MKREFNRKQYDKVRKMDHNQMAQYFNSVYQAGFDSGMRAAENVQELPELSGLENELEEIKGIGNAKARAICEKVKVFLERKVSGSDETGA